MGGLGLGYKVGLGDDGLRRGCKGDMKGNWGFGCGVITDSCTQKANRLLIPIITLLTDD